MIQGRSKTCSRSAASRRARLAVFVLSAVLSSSVLAAPTIRPRALALSFSEPDPAPTQTSSGPGSLSGGGRGDWELGRVDYSPVVLRQDVDGLQTFDDPEDVKDSSGSDSLPNLSARESVDLSKRGGCLSCTKKHDDIELGAMGNTGTAQDPTAPGVLQDPPAEEERTPSRSAEVERTPSRSAGTERTSSRSAEVERTPSRSADVERNPSRSAEAERTPSRSAEAIDEERRRLEKQLELNAVELKKIEGEALKIRNNVSYQQDHATWLSGEHKEKTREMLKTACTARDMGIDVQAHGGVSFQRYDYTFDLVEFIVNHAQYFRQASQATLLPANFTQCGRSGFGLSPEQRNEDGGVRGEDERWRLYVVFVRLYHEGRGLEESL
ncbi:hypothetical protein F5878DRAFT_646438 [Lentinula raphanica]|uniref:Uncharacterized protein n=1 Tax=Lentinula raphanica TaxID=153919 RepID=A0AA38NYK3_9AGAR|nr:hypothetical protein F5878DRAFT_646438 [Lentinula raphanica]